MTDIFQHWKNNTFIVVGEELLDQHEHLIILTDVSFWNTNYEQLKDWCDENLALTQGMTVTCPNEQVLTLFCLRWS